MRAFEAPEVKEVRNRAKASARLVLLNAVVRELNRDIARGQPQKAPNNDLFEAIVCQMAICADLLENVVYIVGAQWTEQSMRLRLAGDLRNRSGLTLLNVLLFAHGSVALFQRLQLAGGHPAWQKSAQAAPEDPLGLRAEIMDAFVACRLRSRGGLNDGFIDEH
jgi:hypothetical protein